MRLKHFTSTQAEIPNFNITTSAIWARQAFTCSEDANWYLQVDPAVFNEVRCFQQTRGGPWKEERIGNAYPASQRALALSHFLLRLNLRAGDTTVVYVRVQDYYPMQFDFRAGTLEAFVAPIHNGDLYSGICFGIMIMMMLYNLFLFATQRSIVYLYYVLYVLCSLTFTAYLSGYALHFPAPVLRLMRFAPIIPPAGFGIFGMLFTLRLFGETLSARFKKIVNVFMSIAFLDIVLSATPFVHLSEEIIQPLGLLLGILSVTAAVIALRKKHSSAVYYLLGFGAYMGSLFYLILSAQGVFAINNFTWHVLASGSAVESIMLSFALGDKLKASLREQQQAREEALKQATENERLVKEQNVLLEQKVRERTVELEEKNKEVLDSIHYARRIQYALLANETFLEQRLPPHFILFKPKDIVSGDFYWATMVNPPKDGSYLYLAVCDSTGHGVPGAFMSLLNISFLNEAVNDKKILEPNAIFDHVRRRLTQTQGGKDGMDGILVSFDEAFSNMHYAAANNAPLLIRDGAIVELPKDKMPVGRGEKEEPFSMHSISLKKGDRIYLFTDGFGDQFGGPAGKKFKRRQLTEKLLQLHKETPAVQKDLLERTFADWKGRLEQVDDVLVVGISC